MTTARDDRFMPVNSIPLLSHSLSLSLSDPPLVPIKVQLLYRQHVLREIRANITAHVRTQRTDTRTHTQTDKQTDRQTDRHTDRHMHTHTGTQTVRQTHTYIYNLSKDIQ